MAGTVYLRTNRFEVKLEGITFKKKNFESLCKMDFLFPDGKVWDRRPIVGLDVMCHPRDPSIILLLLCFGIGCVILRFGAGEALPAPIHRFLADKRIRVVGFGVPEKMDLFPFEELGLTKSEVDIGYLAAKVFKDPKYKRCELDELARKVLGIKRMMGLTEASSFERHEQIKCAICQLFISSVIAMGLLGANDKKKTQNSSKKSSFLKNLNSLHLLAEGWFKLPKRKKKKQKPDDDVEVRIGKMEHMLDHHNVLINNVKSKEGPFVDYFDDAETPSGDSGDYSFLAKFNEDASGNYHLVDTEYSKGYCYEYEKDYKESDSSDDSAKEVSPTTKKPIKGILKCPSTKLLRSDSSGSKSATPPSPSTPSNLKRANSKGCNVSFKFH